MTAKDYRALAVAFQRALQEVANHTEHPAEAAWALGIAIDEVAHMLAMDNKRFDKAWFVEACQ